MTGRFVRTRMGSRTLLVLAVALMTLVPAAVFAAGGFDDVSDDNQYAADIAWIADAGVTKGCNPPDNTLFCPEDDVTREEMAAFLHRLAVNRVVDAGTVEGLTAAELKGQTGDTGPAGAPGADGADGAPGLDGDDGAPGADGADGADGFGSVSFYQVSESVDLGFGETTPSGFLATCNPGDFVTGGGYRITSFGTATNNIPSGPGAWLVSVTVVQAGTVDVYAVCAHVTPPEPLP